jgi:hypothetical protein
MNNEYAKQVADNMADAASDIAHGLKLLEKAVEPQDKSAIRNRMSKRLEYIEKAQAEIRLMLRV